MELIRKPVILFLSNKTVLSKPVLCHVINVYRVSGYFFSLVYFLVGWHAVAVSLPLGDAIFAQLPRPLNDVIDYLYRDQA